MADQVMFITDTNGIIEYVNPAFERVTGYSAEEAIGKTPRILKSGHQSTEFYEDLWTTIKSGDTWEAELTNQTKSGRLYRARQKIVPITNAEGELTHFAAIEPDITERELTEQVIEVLSRILRHNVRSAVSVIDGYAELVETTTDPDEQAMALRSIREQTAALLEISEKTRTARKLLLGQTDPIPLDIGQFESMVADYRAEYPEAVIEVDIQLDEERAIQNGRVFQIALDEIIENAVRHSDQTTPRIEITIAWSEEAGNARVRVADNGPGIPRADWEIIKTGTETPLNHADGIGLWVIYWSITALGGTVALSENEPRGSVLTLDVPLNPE